MKRLVALKLLDSGYYHTPEAIELFEREMVSVARLSHPGIVQAYDAGDRDGQCYIMMELVDGEDCGSLVRRHGRLPVAECCEIVRQAALALHHAHGKGLVHRDIKPGNLILSRHEPVVKICDFGLAGLSPSFVADAAGEVPDGRADGHFVGTMEYIAPEQITAPERVDARADLYALGATLRRFLTGESGREGISEETLMFRARAIASKPVGPIGTLRPDLPAGLARVCDQLMAIDPDQRPASAAVVADLLEPWCCDAELLRLFGAGPLVEKRLAPPRIRRSRHRAVAALACVGLIGAGVGFHLWSRSSGAVAEEDQGWRPVFSEQYRIDRGLSPESEPRLYGKDWEREREFIDRFSKSAARLAPDGRVVRIDAEQPSPLQWTGGDELSPVLDFVPHPHVRSFGIAPTGHFVWSQSEEPDGFQIGRALPDGTAIAPLRYDFASDYPAGLYEMARLFVRQKGHPFCDGQPWGFAFVTEDNLPQHTGLRAGDVLLADGGHRGIPGVRESKSALWKFRLDDDAPAKRLSSPSEDTLYLGDTTVSRHGVFAINRIHVGMERLPESDPRNLRDRLLRWDLDGWHSCDLDLPVTDPCGIAADPLSEDLYIMTGSASRAIDPATQRVLKLSPRGPDSYRVEVFADRFSTVSDLGIAITPDGQRMILTDQRGNGIVVLKRKNK
jgi:hypothetical protein